MQCNPIEHCEGFQVTAMTTIRQMMMIVAVLPISIALPIPSRGEEEVVAAALFLHSWFFFFVLCLGGNSGGCSCPYILEDEGNDK